MQIPRTKSSLDKILALKAKAEKFRKIREQEEALSHARVFSVRDLLFPRQLEILDALRRHRWHAWRCTRRAGKTNLAVAALFDVALATSRDVVYVGITSEAAVAQIWEPSEGLGVVAIAQSIGAHIDKGTHTVTLQNGARIFIRGVKDDSVATRFRGFKFALAILDECQSIPPGIIRPFVERVLGPALSDSQGATVLSGTPGEFEVGMFWEVCERNSDPKYQVHHWSWADNPYVAENVGRDAEERRKAFGDDDPVYQREYCGKWVVNKSSLVLSHFSARNEYAISELPPRETLLCTTVGGDLGGGGLGDPMACAAWAVFRDSPYKWLVYERELFRSEATPDLPLTDSDFLSMVDEVQQSWGPVVAAVHDSVIAIAPGLNRRFPVLPAKKLEKAQQLRVMDDDCRSGVIKVPAGGLFARQARTVFWDLDALDKGKRVPTSRVPNDVQDCSQYAYTALVNHQQLQPKMLTSSEKAAHDAKARARAQTNVRDWQTAMLGKR